MMSDDATAAAPGAPMPDLALVSPHGEQTTLHGELAGRPAVLYFHRSSTCPVCAAHARALQAMRADGRLGERALLLVVPGGADEAAHVARRHRLLDERVVWASGSGHAQAGFGRFLALQHSGVLLVSRAGTVEYRRSAAVPVQSFEARELREALAAHARGR
ncbi:redoxin domain-containing protein [Cellulomonas sp.]|uniref:peroxiredoxin family protein n=1 Tax=Cellulomonas sp. TaxID=40001 RepID=UPI002586343C|nr:redoxin domain-containing protein [Cellulomonas sp.]MCR6688968.1 redoxin domain-containing protein [Cellulomonas sp.]